MGCGTSKTAVLRERQEILPDAIAFAEQDANAEAHALQNQEKAEIALRSTHEAAEAHGKDGYGTSHRSFSEKPSSEEKISKVSLDEAQKLAIDAVEQIWDDLLMQDAKQVHVSVWPPRLQAQMSEWTSTPTYDEVADVLRWPDGSATAVLTRTMVETANLMWERGGENAPSDVSECYVLEDAKAHLEAYKCLLADPSEGGGLAKVQERCDTLSTLCPHAENESLVNDGDLPFNLLVSASKAYAPLVKLAKGLSTGDAGQVASYEAGTKSLDGLFRKVHSACGACRDSGELKWNSIVDVARASIRFSSLNDMARVIAELCSKQDDVEVLRVRNRLTNTQDQGLPGNGGYRFVAVAVRVAKQRHICELLLEHTRLREACSPEQHSRYLRASCSTTSGLSTTSLLLGWLQHCERFKDSTRRKQAMHKKGQ